MLRITQKLFLLISLKFCRHLDNNITQLVNPELTPNHGEKRVARKIPLVYNPDVPLVYNRLYWVTKPVNKLQITPKRQFEEMTNNRARNDDGFIEAARVVDEIRRRNKKPSLQFHKLYNDKETLGKKRIKRSITERTSRLVQDVRNNDELRVNESDFNADEAVINSGGPQFKILIPNQETHKHKYVPIFRNCNDTNEKSAVEEARNEEENKKNEDEIDKTVEFIQVDNANISRVKEISEEERKKVDGSEERSSRIRVSTDPVEDDEKEEEIRENEEINDKEEEIREREIENKENEEEIYEKEEEDEKNEEVDEKKEEIREIEEIPEANHSQDEEEKERKVIKEEPKFDFDINEYRKPFDLDEFLEKDPIFGQINAKENPAEQRSQQQVAKPVITEEEESSEEVFKPSQINSEDSKEESEEKEEISEPKEEVEEIEVDESDKDFLRSIFKKKAKYETPDEEKSEFLSQYFSKDIIAKLGEDPQEEKEEEEGESKDVQEEEVYKTLSSILKGRNNNPELSEKTRGKLKEKGESPRAYNTFWSLEYESPHADAEGEKR